MSDQSRCNRNNKEIVAYYNVSEGLCFPSAGMGARCKRVINSQRLLLGEPGLDEWPRIPVEVLPLLENVVTDISQRAAVVMDFVEMVVPMGDLSYMGEADKANLVTLQRWSSDPALLMSDNLVILVAENLSDVHRRVVSSAQLVPAAKHSSRAPDNI